MRSVRLVAILWLASLGTLAALPSSGAIAPAGLGERDSWAACVAEVWLVKPRLPFADLGPGSRIAVVLVGPRRQELFAAALSPAAVLRVKRWARSHLADNAETGSWRAPLCELTRREDV